MTKRQIQTGSEGFSAAYDIALGFMAILTGLLAGWADFKSDEPQSAVILLLAFGLLLGMASQRIAWLWAMLLGVGVPLAYLIGRALGFSPVDWPQPALYASLLALIPAFIGVYVGAGVRTLTRN